MKETAESLVILIGICVIAAVVNEIAGYELVQVELSDKTIKNRRRE